MSSFLVDETVRPLVAWALRHGARRRLAAAPVGADLGALSRAQAARLLRTIDAVVDEASPRLLPFAQFAALDALGAELADWLRDAPAERPLAA